MSRRPIPQSTEKALDNAHALSDRHFWTLVALILVVGVLFRLPGIGNRSLWIDELYTEWFSSRSFAELWQDVPRYETHPPVYYTLLKLWTMLFGNSELGLRSLSLLASIATIFIVATSGRLLNAGRLGRLTGLLGAALLAVNYSNIREAQNARPYSLQIFFLTIAILAAVVLVTRLSRQLTDPALSERWPAPAAVLGISAGCALWLHNTSLLIAFGLWCGLLLSLIATPAEQRLRNFIVFLAAGILALAVWSPYLPIFIQQSRAFAGLGFWLEPKPRDLYSAWLLLIGNSSPALALSIALLTLGLYRLVRCRLDIALVVAATLLVPLCTILAVSFAIKPIYIQRLFAWMVPLALTVMALGILAAGPRIWARSALALVAIVFSGVSSIGDIGRPIDDWKAIVAEIADNASSGDVVIASPAEGIIALEYYAKRQSHFPPIVCVPGCYPQRGLSRAYGSNLGAPRLIEADGRIVDEAVKTHGRVWLVQVSVQLYDPKNIVRSRLAATRTFVRYYGNSLARVDLFE